MLCEVPALVRVDDEMLVVAPRQHLVGRLHDGVGDLRVEAAGLLVRHRRGLLDPDLRLHERPERLEAADWEVLAGAERLHAVKRVGGDLQLAEGILLGAELVGHCR
jgi:hypothetical protein